MKMCIVYIKINLFKKNCLGLRYSINKTYCKYVHRHELNDDNYVNINLLYLLK